MKNLNLFILLFAVAFLFSFLDVKKNRNQKKENLRGEFCYNTGFESECINFLNDSQFTYYSSSCTGGLEGKGNYVFQKNKLILNFKKDESIKPKFYAKIDSSLTKNDSIKIQVQVFDAESKAKIDYVQFILKDLNGKFIKGVETDSNGKGIIQIPKTDKNIEINFMAVGCNTERLNINASRNYNISLFLIERLGRSIPEGKKMEFGIKTISNKKILLKSSNENSKFEIYYRVEK